MNIRAASISDTWDVNSDFWIQIIRERRDRYRTELTDPAIMNAVGPAERLNVLDAGCGEGYLSRALARKGAVVTGIDLSRSLIIAAKEAASTDEIEATFDIGSLYELPYESEAFDLVVCNHAINDLENPAIAIREFARVLRSNGRLIILMLHPCFYSSHAERDQGVSHAIAASYFSERSIYQTFKVDGLISPTGNTARFRPLEYYIEQLRLSSMSVAALIEPHPTVEQMRNDPWWREKFTRPLFMLITAESR